MDRSNCIIEGSLKGYDIKADSDNYVYVGGGLLYLDLENTISIEKISEATNNYKDVIAFWFGSLAAAGASDVKDFVIKIQWSNGQESLAVVTDTMYTKILATRMVNVKQVNERKKAYKESIKIEKQYQLACSYQESHQFLSAKKKFEEISGYKDSRERLVQIEKELKKIKNDDNKRAEISNLKSEYKKYFYVSRISGVFSIIIVIMTYVLAIANYTSLMFSPLETVAYVTPIPILLLAGCYFLMSWFFKSKLKQESELNEAYDSIKCDKGVRPGKKFMILTIIFIIITIIVGIWASTHVIH
jgi:hypothetical protein